MVWRHSRLPTEFKWILSSETVSDGGLYLLIVLYFSWLSLNECFVPTGSISCLLKPQVGIASNITAVSGTASPTAQVPSHSDLGASLGGVFGGLARLVVVGIIVFLLLRKWR